jgi:hypothetical protein
MRISIIEVDELIFDDYLLYLRDAFVWKQMQSEDGREYLEKCHQLQQTKPDREKLREIFGKGANNG